MASHLELTGSAAYDQLLDARTGELLERHNQVYSAGPQALVYTAQSPKGATQQIVSFTGWVSDRATSGNNANVYEDRDGNNASDYQTQTPASGDPNYQHFNYAFSDAWETNADGTAASLNADRDAILTQFFYWQNFTHDFLYALGFNEASGNFQVDNFGRGGTGGDAVQAEAFDSFNTGANCNANFGTNADGSVARMQVFVGNGSSSSCPYRLSELEGDTIVHETGHGVFTRLINGGMGEGSGVQKGGMDEGIGDFLAILGLRRPGRLRVGFEQCLHGSAPRAVRHEHVDLRRHLQQRAARSTTTARSGRRRCGTSASC